MIKKIRNAGIKILDIKKILDEFEIGKIWKISRIKTSGNIAYKIRAADIDYFLRLSPTADPRWRSREEILAELELLEYLRKNNFLVPELIAMKKGDFLISLKRHNGYVRKFINGKEKLTPTFSDIEKFGKKLGEFHKLIQNYKMKYERKHRWGIYETKKILQKNKKFILQNDRVYGEKFIDSFEKEMKELKFSKKLPKGTIHEDLGKRHVIWNKNNIAGIIDFDRAYYGKIILDLGQVCRGWCFDVKWTKWENKKFEALMKGYFTERKLSKIEKDYLVPAIKFAIIERGLSFYLKYLFNKGKMGDLKFALNSVLNRGLLKLVDDNKEKIEKVLQK